MIAGCMIVKKGASVTKAIGSLYPCCDDVIVIEDASPGEWSLQEWELRQQYVDRLEAIKADWAVSIDADEYLVGGEWLRKFMEIQGETVRGIDFDRINLWGNGVYALDSMTRAWRPRPGHRISQKWIATASCPNSVVHEGETIHVTPDRACIVHTGYMTEAARAEKARRYREIDPHNHVMPGFCYEEYFLHNQDLRPIPDSYWKFMDGNCR